jgi:hypothetical protein
MDAKKAAEDCDQEYFRDAIEMAEYPDQAVGHPSQWIQEDLVGQLPNQRFLSHR